MKAHSWIATISLVVAVAAGLGTASAIAQDNMRSGSPMRSNVGTISRADFERLQQEVRALEQRVSALEKNAHHGKVTGTDNWNQQQ
jgi:hypothetical protein